MLTVIIATHESERALVQTLAPLVSGATAGLITEVIIADAGSTDATAEIADIAGCRYLGGDAAAGGRLKRAAAEARTPWLMFLRPGTVPEPGWVEAVERFIGGGSETERAAVFAGAATTSPSPDWPPHWWHCAPLCSAALHRPTRAC
jgi:glycosyltransferase involved in cell wall biosynthesis